MSNKKVLTNLFYLTCAVFVLKFISIFLNPLHHPSEARYASIALRMSLTQNYLMPFFDPLTPFFGKPPLAFWASAFSLEIFGQNEFAARLPHYLALLLCSIILFQTVKKIFDEKTAMFAVVILSSSLIFFMIHAVMTEAFLLLAMTMISCSFLLILRGEKFYDLLFFLGCVISMLTKGPVGIVMPCLAIPFYLSFNHEWRNFFKKFPLICGTIFFTSATLPWFLLAEKNYPGFLNYFLLGENLSRFTQSSWAGDRYGNAHHVPFAMIWIFFLGTTMPAILAFFIRPFALKNTLIAEIKKDRDLQFFAWSFLLPMLLLTFMRNMIGTYPIYVLTPFAIILARLLVRINWDKFVYFLSGITIFLHLAIITLFLLKPSFLMQKINYQSYLLNHITHKDYQLYHLEDDRTIFTLYWETKDGMKVINQNNFFDVVDLNSPKPSYLTADAASFDKLPTDQKSHFKILTCTNFNGFCLYEFIR